MSNRLDRPTLEQHVKIGQAKKDFHRALRRFMDLTCTIKAPGHFLYAKETDKLCDLHNVGIVDLVCSRLEDVMFKDYPWLSNDAFGVYYHEDEKMTVRKLYETAGKEYKPEKDPSETKITEQTSMDRLRSILNTIDEKTDDLLEIADVLEAHQINVKLDDGRYLNPVAAIRTKVDIIWDEVQALYRMAR